MRILSLCLALAATPALSHEFWLEPLVYQAPADAMLAATIVNGQNFSGSEIAYFPQRFARFDMVLNGAVVPVDGRTGNSPALLAPTLGDGLHVAVYQSTNDVVHYEEFEKFIRFTEHKGYAGIAETHAARGLSTENVTEVYARFVKSLIGVGSGAGSDQRMGLETELVALDNPYTDNVNGGMRLQLFYNNAPRANVQVEVWAKPAGSDPVLYMTDGNGIVTIAVAPGGEYLVNSVVLREPDAAKAAEYAASWESLWASMTFAVPD